VLRKAANSVDPIIDEDDFYIDLRLHHIPSDRYVVGSMSMNGPEAR
jgi:hypothetical protein